LIISTNKGSLSVLTQQQKQQILKFLASSAQQNTLVKEVIEKEE